MPTRKRLPAHAAPMVAPMVLVVAVTSRATGGVKKPAPATWQRNARGDERKDRKAGFKFGVRKEVGERKEAWQRRERGFALLSGSRNMVRGKPRARRQRLGGAARRSAVGHRGGR